MRKAILLAILLATACAEKRLPRDPLAIARAEIAKRHVANAHCYARAGLVANTNEEIKQAALAEKYSGERLSCESVLISGADGRALCSVRKCRKESK